MSQMKPRERLLAALNHQEPDRIPMDLGGINSSLMVGTYEKLKSHLGMDDLSTKVISKTWQIVEPDERILQRLRIDTRYLFPKIKPLQRQSQEKETSSRQPSGDVEESFVDEWGVRRRFILHYYEIADHPLRLASRLNDIDSHPWPDPRDYIMLDGLRERARYLRENTDYALVGYMGGASIFEQSWYLRGYAELLLDLLINKNIAHALLSKVLEVRKLNAEMYLREVGDYLDVFQFGDDIATQNEPVMSPALYREMLKPYHAELFRFIKNRTPAKLYCHSCGAVSPLIEDLIEIGVDALNPIQVSAKGMDTSELKRRFGNRIAFWGAIDSQRALPFGTCEEVRTEVKKRIRDLAPGGGYVLAGVHNLQPDVPPQNILAMYEEGALSGRYPTEA